MPRNWFAVLRGAALIALAFVLAAGPLFTAANAQEAETVVNMKLYGALAPKGAMVGSNAEAHTGDGSWNSNKATVEFYIDPAKFGLGTLTIGDIESISYYSKNAPVEAAGISRGVDFGLYIYTTKPEGQVDPWYGERLVAEPLYSYSDPATADPDDTWNLWSTDKLVWYPAGHSVSMGFYTAPTLAQIQKNGFKWADYWDGGDATEIDYSAMEIQSFKFGTGSAWGQHFDGYLDTIQFKFKVEGVSYTFNIDLENQPTQLFVDADWATVPDGTDPDGNGPAAMMGVDAFAAIQPAINAAPAGATISIFPNNSAKTGESDYPTGISITKVDPKTGGPGGNSFILFVNKPGLTLQGVKDDGTPITSPDEVEALITATANAPTFGASVLFIQADDVTVSGLELAPFTPNKTIEVWGDNFTLKNSVVHSGQGAATLYFNEDKVSAYFVDNNILNGGIAVSSGAGSTGDRSTRVITNNLIESTIYGVGFRGTNPNVGWLTKPVGGAVIQNNTFIGSPYGHVYAEGEYAEDELLWEEILNTNVFDKMVGLMDTDNNLVNATWNFGYERPNVRRIGSVIQYELDRAEDGNVIYLSPGLFPEALEFKAGVSGLRLVGYGIDQSIIEAADGTPGGAVTLAGEGTIIQGVTIRNNDAAPKSMGVVFGYQAAGSALALSKVEGFITGVYLSDKVDGAVVESNEITRNANGILIEGELNNTSIQFNNIIDNTLEDDYWTDKLNASIRLLNGFTGSNNVIQGNALVGSARGVDNNSATPFVAAGNWWGSKYGPEKGSKTQGDVFADPWLCSGVDTDPSFPGFQPEVATCTTAPATRLTFSTQPVNRMMKEDFTNAISVRVEDDNGNLVVGYKGEITLALNTFSQKGALEGDLKATVVDGIATFPHLCVNGFGKGFTITATAQGLTPAVSNPFDVGAYMQYMPSIFK